MKKQAVNNHTARHTFLTEPPYTEAEQNRLLQHLLQIENNFNNRLNTFLVLQTILFSAATLLYTSKQIIGNFMLLCIIILGLGMTLIWGYANARQRYVYLSIKRRCIKELREFRDTQNERAIWRWPVSTTVILTFITPALMLVVWVAFLVYLLVKSY
jgi:hypothetical protein